MIYNATRKYILKIKRQGGDLEIRVENLNGLIDFVEWFQMKKPYKKSYQKIEEKFEEIKNLLERQEE